MAITPLPPAPLRSDAPETFVTKADAFLGALNQFGVECNELGVAMTLNATNSTSTTLLTIGLGSQSLTVQANKSYMVGMSVKMTRGVDPTKWMLGDVTSYTTATGALVVNVLYSEGSGAAGGWVISQAVAMTGNAALTSINSGQVAGLRNRIINGGMKIWQRSTSVVGTSGYLSADRFFVNGTGTVTNTKQLTPDSPSGNFSYIWTTGAASSYVNVSQAIEKDNVYSLRGEIVTVSYNVKSTVGYTGNQTPFIYYSNSSDALNVSAGLITPTAVTAIAPTISWQQAKATFLIPADAVGLTVMMNTSSAQASGVSVYLADLQLEIGSVVTPFEQRPQGMELALCQRYYSTSGLVRMAGYQSIGNATTQFVTYPTQMRVVPTVTAKTTGTLSNVSTVSFINLGNEGYGLALTATATGAVGLNDYVLQQTAEL